MSLVKIRPRTPRFRTRPLMQTQRRLETRPAAQSYAVGADGRELLTPADANPDAPRITLGTAGGSGGGAGPTRHGFPYAATGPEWTDNFASMWDYPLNAHFMESQIVPGSAGRGATDVRRAGSDLAARIYSVKTWAINGSLYGVDLSDTVAAGNSLLVSRVNGFDTRSERDGTPLTGRQFRPTEFSTFYQINEDDNDASTRIHLSLTWPAAAYSGGDWSTTRYMGAGSLGGVPIMAPAIRGFLTANVRDTEGDITNGRIIRIQPELVKTFVETNYWPQESLPITLCGYVLRGHVSPGAAAGALEGSIAITASEFWGPDEWVA